MEYRPGCYNHVADFLSRSPAPVDEAPLESLDDEECVLMLSGDYGRAVRSGLAGE